jgi:hypothetical protein
MSRVGKTARQRVAAAGYRRDVDAIMMAVKFLLQKPV